MDKIFQEYVLDDSVLRLESIMKSINENFEKQLQRNPSSEYINKILEKTPANKFTF